MSNEQNQSDAKAHPVDTLVMLACPFCGSTNTDESMVRGYKKSAEMNQPIIAAGCYDCGATGPQVSVPDHSTGYSEAMTGWNTRAT